MSSLRYRSVFISDFHLGTRWCRAKSLASFLGSMECDKLYLVGDIIDGWKLKRSPGWPGSHNSVIRKVLKLSKKTPVTYIPGNHDEFMKEFQGYSFGGVKIRENAIHTGTDGKRYLVVHGHEFDVAVMYKPWLAFLGDRAYDFALHLNTGFNAVRSFFGFSYWSLSEFLKRKVKDAVKFIGHYEECVARTARKYGVDGIICGHIHNPSIKRFDGIDYFNCGDWVESCSALVEHLDGAMEIIRWFEKKPLEGEEQIVFLGERQAVQAAD
jgi:UDP-2,3-diacylglucosamine pyrophosphatase LpxH